MLTFFFPKESIVKRPRPILENIRVGNNIMVYTVPLTD